MFKWMRRRRLSAESRRKLLIVVARSEEAIVETHIDNVLDLLDTLGGEIDVDRALDLYVEAMSLPEDLAATVSNRLLARTEPVAARDKSGARRYENVFRDRS